MARILNTAQQKQTHSQNRKERMQMFSYTSTPVRDTGARGLYVAAVSHNNDFQVGDRIIGVNGIGVTSSGEIRDIISVCQVGDVMRVTVLRDGRPAEIRVTLTEADAA